MESPDKLTVCTILLLLSLGVLLFSKVALISSLLILICYFFNFRKKIKNKRTIYGFLIIIFILLVSYAINLEMVNQFFDERVFRVGYEKDQKILGFSDGGRIEVWKAFIDGAVLWGKGTVDLITVIPTHNVFVYFINEIGIIPGVLLSIYFIFIVMSYLKMRLYLFSFLFILISITSSFFEYSSIWIPFLWLFPTLLSNEYGLNFKFNNFRGGR
ncbi:hypothetical protein ACSTD6_20275 [Vibrio vulnificus]|uniref:hypothetical protein n=1 Tax=Vibrio vulnificus TaxID=672 RepID=UPI003ED8BC6A